MAILQRKVQNNAQKMANSRIIDVTKEYDTYFSNGVLEEIREFHEEGHCVEDIADTFGRPVMEIIYALLILADEGKLTRPFAYRRGKE
ncbi:hypothetical protein [Ornithinibacillus sp. JPR2-1]|uniref:hypothetical protein n=1 Tax=Ornithinibacillus sp. JPR2-1 TaxID=2094019 RepID=UPI0031D53E3C